MTATDILKEAESIVNGDRMKFYGHPSANHGCTAALWTAYLNRRCDRGDAGYVLELSARDVCMLNILQKISRDANRRKEDNLTDIIGYAVNAAMIEDRETSPDAGKGEG